MNLPFYYMPAEWAPHESTWLTWPKDPITWPNRVEQAQQAYCKIIEALSPSEKVNLLVDDFETKQLVLKQLKDYSPHLPNLVFHLIPTADSWIRDYGPIFVKALPMSLNSPRYALDFIFNAWGNKYESLKEDDDIPIKLQNTLKIEVLQPGFVLEGGSIDVNGAGCLLTTKQCLLNPNRNPHLTQSEIEEKLKQYFGVQQIIWLGDGIEGDDTDGHVDDITRFVSENTIVSVVEEDRNDPNYLPLKENVDHLKSIQNLKGKPFEIIELPMPGRLERDDGSRLPASYANFYIANEVVLVPIYKHKNDALALNRLQNLFPKRKVIGIDCSDLIWGMGAIHCLTQQEIK